MIRRPVTTAFTLLRSFQAAGNNDINVCEATARRGHVDWL